MRNASYLGLLANEGREALGFRFLFRGEKKVGHEPLRGKRGGGFSNPVGIRLYGTKNPPAFQPPTPASRRRQRQRRFRLPLVRRWSVSSARGCRASPWPFSPPCWPPHACSPAAAPVPLPLTVTAPVDAPAAMPAPGPPPAPPGKPSPPPAYLVDVPRGRGLETGLVPRDGRPGLYDLFVGPADEPHAVHLLASVEIRPGESSPPPPAVPGDYRVGPYHVVGNPAFVTRVRQALPEWTEDR